MRYLAWLCVVLGVVLLVWAGLSLLGDDEPGSVAQQEAASSGEEPDAGPRTRGARQLDVNRYGTTDHPDRPGGDRKPGRTNGPAGLMVVDPDGKPIPGARVGFGRAYSINYQDFDRVLVTDEDGIIPLDRRLRGHRVWYCLHGDGEGFLLRDEVKGDTHPMLCLRRKVTVFVRVVDEAGRPRSDRKVWLTGDPPPRRSPADRTQLDAQHTRRTDATGVARFTVRGGDPWLGRASEFRAYFRLTRGGTVAFDPDAPMIRMEVVEPDAAFVLSIRAVDDEGRHRPVDARVVCAVLFTGAVDENDYTVRVDSGWGRMEFPREVQRLKAVASRHLGSGGLLDPGGWQEPWNALEAAEWRDVPEGADSLAIDVPVTALPPVVTVPLTGPDRTPWAARPVVLIPESAHSAAGVDRITTTTDLEGKLRFVGGKACRWTVEPGSSRPDAFAATEFALPRTETDVELSPVALPPPHLLVSGHVLDHDGEPVPETRVHVLPADGERGVVRLVRPDGGFRIHAARTPTSGAVTIEARTPDGRKSPRAVVAVGTSDVALRLEPTGDVTGSIVPKEPMPRFKVTVLHPVRGRIAARPMLEATPSGRFELEAIPAGIVAVCLETESGLERVISGVVIEAGEKTAPRQLQGIDLSDALAQFDVRVVDAGGAPIAGAFIFYTVLRDGGTAQTYEAEADDRGSARFNAVPGRSLLRAEAPDGTSNVVLDPGTPAEVVVSKLTCTVRVPNGFRGKVRFEQVVPGCPKGLARQLPWSLHKIEDGMDKDVGLVPGSYKVALRPFKGGQQAMGIHEVSRERTNIDLSRKR